MKEQADNEDILRAILKGNDLEKPNEQFTERMKHLIVEKYRSSEANGSEPNQWPARIVLCIAIAWCSILLNHLSFSMLNPANFTVAAFLLGLGAVIILLRKLQHLV
jgi:hypothetical protein